MGRRTAALGTALLLLAAASCARPAWLPSWLGGGTPPAPAAPAGPRFSGERAWRHLEELVAIGARPAGSEGAARARAYIRGQLEALGLAVHERAFELGAGAQRVRVAHLIGVVPGEVSDLFLLGALYDTAPLPEPGFVGANGAAAGPALLLELARALSERPLPYTTWLLFLDGEALDAPWAPGVGFGGSRAYARQLAARGVLARVRLAVFFDQVADAELRLTRDLRSRRPDREAFWRAAARLGHADAFDPAAPAERLATSHLGFLEAGLRRVVAIADNRYGGDEPPGRYWNTPDDTLAHCSAESLAAVGSVALAALDDLAARLRTADRFAPRGPGAGDSEPRAVAPPPDEPAGGDPGAP